MEIGKKIWRDGEKAMNRNRWYIDTDEKGDVV